jgi:hypothetical protein
MSDQPKYAIVPVEHPNPMLTQMNRQLYAEILAAAPPPPGIVEALERIANMGMPVQREEHRIARAALDQWYGREG